MTERPTPWTVTSSRIVHRDDNLTHVVLATGAALTGVPADDPHERVRAHLRPAAAVVALARVGGITQALHVTGLALGLTELGLWRKSADVCPHP